VPDQGSGFGPGISLSDQVTAHVNQLIKQSQITVNPPVYHEEIPLSCMRVTPLKVGSNPKNKKSQPHSKEETNQ